MTNPAPRTAPEAAILIERMNKWYGNFHVLRDIDLTVTRGERIVIRNVQALAAQAEAPGDEL